MPAQRRQESCERSACFPLTPVRKRRSCFNGRLGGSASLYLSGEALSLGGFSCCCFLFLILIESCQISVYVLSQKVVRRRQTDLRRPASPYSDFLRLPQPVDHLISHIKKPAALRRLQPLVRA